MGLKFTPTLNSVQHECVRKRIALLDSDTYHGLISILWGSRIHEEWLIACRASSEENDILYYVSQYHKVRNSIFTFIDTGIDERVMVNNVFTNVSVADASRIPIRTRFLENDVED